MTCRRNVLGQSTPCGAGTQLLISDRCEQQHRLASAAVNAARVIKAAESIERYRCAISGCHDLETITVCRIQFVSRMASAYRYFRCLAAALAGCPFLNSGTTKVSFDIAFHH